MNFTAARLSRSLAILGVVTAASLTATLPVAAQSASLDGSWSGSGSVVLPSGNTERARCKATFRRQGGDSFTMNAVCATASTRIAQTAQLTRTSSNRYAGEFFNSEYGISGAIRVTVSGRSLSASLSGGGGSGHFNLSK